MKKMEPNPNKINCGLIGGGIYATSTALPILGEIKDITLDSISTASGLNSKSLSEKYNINNLYSDYHDILENKSTDLIFNMTRNSLHAKIVEESLLKNKNVFVEKPLALNFEDLDKKLINIGIPYDQRGSEFSKANLHPILPIISEMRLIKTKEEIDTFISALKRAILMLS